MNNNPYERLIIGFINEYHTLHSITINDFNIVVHLEIMTKITKALGQLFQISPIFV